MYNKTLSFHGVAVNHGVKLASRRTEWGKVYLPAERSLTLNKYWNIRDVSLEDPFLIIHTASQCWLRHRHHFLFQAVINSAELHTYNGDKLHCI